MIIACIALGIVSGIFAAVLTLMSGYGFLMAVAAYVVCGTTVIAASALWTLLPPRTGQVKQPATQQRS